MTNTSYLKITDSIISKEVSSLSDSLDAHPYDVALNYLLNMSSKAIANTAMSLFPENVYQRCLFHCWVKTVQNCQNPNLNPRYYTPNLIGAPGFGKSGLTYEFGEVVKPWLNSIAGGSVGFKVLVRTFAGINDFADIMGIVHVDQNDFSTRLAPPVAFPREGDKTFGILFIDDFNRGHSHVIAAGMEFVNTGLYNDYKLPHGWSMCAASNPQGGKHRVTSIDEAQLTRFVNMPYSPPRKTFINQLVKQDVDNRILTYFMRFKEIAECPPATTVLPEPRVVNWRTCTMFAHLYSSMQHDDVLQTEVAFSFFGPNAMRDLESILNSEMPLSPDEILGGTEEQRAGNNELMTPSHAWEYSEERLKKFEEDRRTDIITVTGHRLVIHLQKETTLLSQEQVNNLARFLMLIPKEVAINCMRQLVQQNAPKSEHYRGLLTTWGSSDGKTAGVLAKRFFEVNQEIQAKIKEINAKSDAKELSK